MYIYTYIYIYICLSLSLYLSIYIYIYIYIEPTRRSTRMRLAAHALYRGAMACVNDCVHALYTACTCPLATILDCLTPSFMTL